MEKLRVICDADELTIYVNGEKVNYAQAEPDEGGDLLAERGAEIEYREIELRPLAKKR